MSITEVDTDTLRALFDLAVGSMNYSSGFFEESDVKVILDVARLIGADMTHESPQYDSYKLTEPHLWHQDCALKWRCGKAADHKIHRPELPA
jgi:hypothetical protein